jgi:hypothetical protein
VYECTETTVEEDDVLLHISMTEESYSTEKLKNQNFGFYYQDANDVKMFSHVGLVSFVPEASCYYEYEVLEFGILIKEFDSQYQNPTYSFVSYDDGQIYDIELDEGYYFDKIESDDDKYFYVREKTDLSLETGKYLYFDSCGSLIIKYDSITDDDKIRYSNDKYILLYNKIIATEKSITAVDYKVLNTDEIYNIFDINLAVNKDYFVVLVKRKIFIHTKAMQFLKQILIKFMNTMVIMLDYIKKDSIFLILKVG